MQDQLILEYENNTGPHRHGKPVNIKKWNQENSALHHRNKLNFKIYSNRKHLFSIVIIFPNNIDFTVFLIK